MTCAPDYIERKEHYCNAVYARLALYPGKSISEVWPEHELQRLHEEIVGTTVGWRRIDPPYE